jgi:hypothetical protein
MGFGGLIFILLILGGAIWLMMLVFGWGPYQVDATATPSPTVTLANSTPVQDATATLQPADTATPTVAATLTETPTLEPMPYILFGEPETITSDLLLPNLGCDWLVIAGQVWDLAGEPVVGLNLHLYGELDGVEIDQQVVSGSAVTYGESGYEFRLQGMVVNSSSRLFLQLVDTNGQPLSTAYGLRTYEDCQKNMILVNFKQVR